MRLPELRLRAPTADLLALPWDLPLSEWTIPDVPLRDIAVGPSRHLVKFVEADGQLWAVKELPRHIADKEYGVLRRLEDICLPAVRPAWCGSPSLIPRSCSPATSPALGSTGVCSGGYHPTNPSTGRDYSMRWPI